MSTSRRRRTGLSRRIRFDVLKRDGFRCQYCGASAPDVVLHVDHIQPVCDHGTNDLTNLITACAACNTGKHDTPLNQDRAPGRGHAQLDALQRRREQLDMMIAWREGVRNLRHETVDRLCTYWTALAPGWRVNGNGRNKLKQWLRRFPSDELLHAMDIAAERYLAFDAAGKPTSDSWALAFSKIPGICRVARESRRDPDVRQLYYIRGILRNRIHERIDEAHVLDRLKAARARGVSVDRLRTIAIRATDWPAFARDMESAPASPNPGSQRTGGDHDAP
ncbi:MAG: HNH endonuclease [Phycisphaerae bacterium]